MSAKRLTTPNQITNRHGVNAGPTRGSLELRGTFTSRSNHRHRPGHGTEGLAEVGVRIVCPLSESVAPGAGRLAASLVVSPRDVDDQVLYAVNWLTRHTPWLHGAALDFATYGVV